MAGWGGGPKNNKCHNRGRGGTTVMDVLCGNGGCWVQHRLGPTRLGRWRAHLTGPGVHVGPPDYLRSIGGRELSEIGRETPRGAPAALVADRAPIEPRGRRHPRNPQLDPRPLVLASVCVCAAKPLRVERLQGGARVSQRVVAPMPGARLNASAIKRSRAFGPSRAHVGGGWGVRPVAKRRTGGLLCVLSNRAAVRTPGNCLHKVLGHAELKTRRCKEVES